MKNSRCIVKKERKKEREKGGKIRDLLPRDRKSYIYVAMYFVRDNFLFSDPDLPWRM